MRRLLAAMAAVVVGAGWADGARAKDTVRIAFVGPLTGGNSAIGLGGRNSADLAVKLRNQDAKAKYQYDLVVLDDECKPDTGVQVATKAGSDRSVVAGVTLMPAPKPAKDDVPQVAAWPLSTSLVFRAQLGAQPDVSAALR